MHSGGIRDFLVFFIFAGLITSSPAVLAKQAEDEEEGPAKAIPVGVASKIKGVRIIKGEDVLKLADDDEEMVIFDARNGAARKSGHIQWSEPFDVKGLTPDFLADAVAAKTTVVVFYGEKNSKTAAQGAAKAAKGGYENVYWFKGGWPEWKAKGLKMDQ